MSITVGRVLIRGRRLVIKVTVRKVMAEIMISESERLETIYFMD